MDLLRDIVATAFGFVVLGTIMVGCLAFIWKMFAPLPARLKVDAFHRGIVLRANRVVRVVDPGAYWILPGSNLIQCDTRPIPFRCAAQEVLTSDGLGIRISVGGEYRAIDLERLLTHSSNAFNAFENEIRQAISVAVAEANSDEFRSTQDQLGARIKELLLPKSSELGIHLDRLAIEEVSQTGWFHRADR